MPILYFHPCVLPNPEQIAFVRRKLPMRGPGWAREYMEKTGGFAGYPSDVRTAVIDFEAALEPAESEQEVLP